MAEPVRLKPSSRWLTDEPLRLQMPREIHVLLVAATVITATIATWVFFGTVITVIWGLALTVAILLWIRTTLRRPLSRRVLPIYVLGVIILLIHNLEQWFKDYAPTLSRVLPDALSPQGNFTKDTLVVIFPIATTTLFLFGAAALFFHHPLGNYSAWLLLVTMIVLPISHFVIGLVAAPIAYVPGMWTAPVVILFAVWAARHFLANRTDGDLR